MKGLTLSRKIALGFAVLIFFFALFGVYANYAGNALNQASKDMKDWNDGLAIVAEIADAGAEARHLAILRVLEPDPARREQINTQLTTARQHVDDLFVRYQQLLQNTEYDSEAERQSDQTLYQNEKILWDAYLDSGKPVDAMLATNDRAAVINLVEVSSREAFEKFRDALNADMSDSIKNAGSQAKESDATYAHVFRVTMGAFFLVLIIAVAFALFLYRTITNSVQDVLKALGEVANGNLGNIMQVTSDDEFGQMSVEFNKAMNNVRQMTKQIQKAANEVAGSSDSLTATAEQSAQATQSVAQSITEVAGAAQSQMEALEVTKQQVDAFRQGINNTTRIIENVTDAICKTVERAQEGDKLVSATVQQMNEVSGTVAQSSKAVAKLGERSKEISSIVQLIASIAGQTNLIALNAAIEAARAGEHGRGFAVVAEEVRKLAEGSQQAAEQIGDLIQKIQEETGKAVSAIETGVKQVEKGRENVTASGKGFAQIMGMIQGVQESSGSMQKNMHDLNDSAGRIAEATTRIHNSAAKVAKESENVSAATEEQAAGMQQIAASSRGLADMARELNSAATKFKT